MLIPPPSFSCAPPLARPKRAVFYECPVDLLMFRTTTRASRLKERNHVRKGTSYFVSSPLSFFLSPLVVVRVFSLRVFLPRNLDFTFPIVLFSRVLATCRRTETRKRRSPRFIGLLSVALAIFLFHLYHSFFTLDVEIGWENEKSSTSASTT